MASWTVIPMPSDESDADPERAVENYEQYGKMVVVQHDHPEYGPMQGWCNRCGRPTYRYGPAHMCVECVRETAGTDDCPICQEYKESICGYHGTCLWYCVDCGMVRRIGNRPVRPGSDATVHCPLDPSGVFEENEHTMVRLTYESLAGKELGRYHRQQGERWNEHTRSEYTRGAADA
jgi:ribosomal protein S14